MGLEDGGQRLPHPFASSSFFSPIRLPIKTPTSDRLLADSELRYPYEESKTLMHVFDSFDDKALILELLKGMYAELPEKKAK